MNPAQPSWISRLKPAVLLLADMCQGSSSAWDPGQGPAMEMHVSALETVGTTRSGGVPGVSPKAGCLERSLYLVHALERYDFPGQEDSFSDPRGRRGQQRSVRADLGLLHACQKAFQEFLPIVTSFHKQTLEPSAFVQLPKKVNDTVVTDVFLCLL